MQVLLERRGSKPMLQRIKVFTGEDIIRRCIRKGNSYICMPKGKAFKFPGYTYVYVEVNENAPAGAGESSNTM